MSTFVPAHRAIGAASADNPARGSGGHWAGFVLTLAFFGIGPFVFYPIFLMKVMCFVLFACAFNLTFGYGGLLSLGHAMFFGSSAYIAAYAAKAWGWPPELAILAGAGVAAVLGFIVGGLCIRRHGIYFAMATLAFAQMIYFAALRLPFTGGEDGIQAVPRGVMFGFLDLSRPAIMYVVVLVITGAGLAAIYRIIHSPFGETLRAIRENETRALSLGYRVNQFKVIAFVMSAALTGVAGATKAIVFQLASLVDVHWLMSGDVVLMVLLGGTRTIYGPVVGATVMLFVEEFLAARAGAWIHVIQGLVFIVCVLVFRRGIVGELSRLFKRPL
jgi:branched-chain amino acid transport system permease protein